MADQFATEKNSSRPLYLYDLPKDLLDSLELELDSKVSRVDADNSDAPTAQDDAATADTPTTKAGLACALCGLSFATVQDQRTHARSDQHAYNLKRKLHGGKPVGGADFEKLASDMDESTSDSDSDSESESDDEDGTEGKKKGYRLSALMKRQGNIDDAGSDDSETFGKRKRGAGNSPIIWFRTPDLPSNTSLGLFRANFTNAEQQDLSNVVQNIRRKQVPPKAHQSSKPKKHDEDSDDGGVSLRAQELGPHMFLCMIGGGHFAAMIVALEPRMIKAHGQAQREVNVIARKTFHRYTTRKGRGTAQSTADNSKPGISSAGSSLRRAQETLLEEDVRGLLAQWKDMIDTSELIFIRAAGTTNRRVLFGPYEGQVLRRDDPRNRGFPFSTRRPTLPELMRAFVTLTRIKVRVIDEAAMAAEAAEEEAARQKAIAQAEAKAQAAADKAARDKKDPEEETALLHTTQIEALIRRAKAPALLSYFTTNSLTADYKLFPFSTHHHTTYPLHMAASINSPAMVIALLTKANANPTLLNGDAKPAFELAGDRATRDAFRLCRGELGESAWDWSASHIPDALTRAELDERAQRDKAEADAAEEQRRKAEIERLEEEEKKRKEARKAAGLARTERKHGKGKVVLPSAEEKREQETRGMTPEMKMRMEREKRARAAEERMRKLAGGH